MSNEQRTSNPRLAILRDDMLAEDCETPVKVYMEASRWAADEIERLTRERDASRDSFMNACAREQTLLAERDRLLACSTGQAWCKFASEAERLRAAIETAIEDRYNHDVFQELQRALAGAPDETDAGHKHLWSGGHPGVSYCIGCGEVL